MNELKELSKGCNCQKCSLTVIVIRPITTLVISGPGQMTAVRPSVQLEEALETVETSQPACQHVIITTTYTITATMAQPPPRKDAYTRFIVNLHKVRGELYYQSADSRE